MAYQVRGKYYNNVEEELKYSEMVLNTKKFIDKDGNFLDNGCSIDIPKEDKDMFFAYNFAILGQTIKEKRIELLEDATNNKALQDNLSMLSKEFFPITGYLDRIIEANNSYYGSFDHGLIDDYNPWIINKRKNNVLENEFNEEPKTNSRIELIAKNLLWSNRATKELNIIRKNIIETKAGEKSKCRTSGKKFEKIVEDLFLDNGEYDGESLYTDFLDKYTAHLYGEFDKEELKNESSYKQVENYKRTNYRDASMDDVFKYVSISFVESLLYNVKDKLIELAVEEIGELKKSKELNGINISKVVDSTSKSQTYGSVLQIEIPGYSAPFSVHANDKYLTDLATKYDVDYDDKNIQSPGLSVCIYKYNEKQTKFFNKFNTARLPDGRIRNCAEYAKKVCKSNEREER